MVDQTKQDWDKAALTKEDWERQVEKLLLVMEIDIQASAVDLTVYWTGHEDNTVPISRQSAILALGLLQELRKTKGVEFAKKNQGAGV